MRKYLVTWIGTTSAKLEQRWGEEICIGKLKAEAYNYFWERLKEFGLSIQGLEDIELSARIHNEKD